MASIAISGSGKFAVSAAGDSATLWDGATGEPLQFYCGHMGQVTRAIFTPSGNQVITASDDNSAALWDRASAERLAQFIGHRGPVTCLTVTDDHQQLLTGSTDSTVRLWALDTGVCEHEFSGQHMGRITALALAPGVVLSCSEDATAVLWNLESGEASHVLVGHTSAVLSGHFTSDRSAVITGGADARAVVFDAVTGGIVATFELHSGGIHTIMPFSDGARVLSAAHDGCGYIWSSRHNATLIAALEPAFTGPRPGVTCATVTTAGDFVLTGSTDGTALLWSTAAPAVPLRRLEVPGGITACSFSPVPAVVTDARGLPARVWTAMIGSGTGVVQCLHTPSDSAE